MDLSRRSWSPATTGPPGPSAANYVAVDGPPGPNVAAMDGPLCRKWSPCSKPEKQWLQLQIDLYILTGEFEVTIKIFRNNRRHACMLVFVAIANLVSLPRPLFSSYSFANRDLGHN